MSKYTIIGRTSPACKYCDKAKELLGAKGIEYEFIDLTGRNTAIEVFKSLGHTTVPLVIDRENGVVIGGYDDLLTCLEEDQDIYPPQHAIVCTAAKIGKGDL